MKTLSIILLSGILLSNCGHSVKDNAHLENTQATEKQVENPKKLILEIADLHLKSLTQKTIDDYRIHISFSPGFYDDIASVLTYRITSDTDQWSETETQLIKELININNDSTGLAQALQIINEKFSSSKTGKIYELRFSKIASKSNMAVSVVGTRFKTVNSKYISGGWEEIVFYEKEPEKWEIRKRIMIMEY